MRVHVCVNASVRVGGGKGSANENLSDTNKTLTHFFTGIPSKRVPENPGTELVAFCLEKPNKK